MERAPRAGRGGTKARLAGALCGLAAVAALASASSHGEPEQAVAAGPAPKPNIVVIETDDQPVGEFRGGVMPFTERRIADRGTRFPRYMVTSPFCCPSRGSLITGQYAHNHEAWNSYETLTEPANNLATWLGNAGYRTALVGKYLNHYDKAVDPVTRPEAGWDQWRMLLQPLTYYGYDVSDNGRRVHLGFNDRAYQTTYLNRQAANIVGRWAPEPKPFFLWMTPHAPHGEKGRSPRRCAGKAVPAPGDEALFGNRELPRPPSFNERRMGDKPQFMRSVPRLGKDDLEELKDARRCRLASLREVDRGVRLIFRTLKEKGELGDTIIVFTSDNGLFEGEHRLKGGKRLPYREAVEVPFAARIPQKVMGTSVPGRIRQPVANIDLAPTFLELAGADPCRAVGDCRILDGRSLVPLLQGDESAWPADRGIGMEMRNCRYVAITADEQVYVEHHSVPVNPIRTQGCTKDFTVEHYDMADDPHQLRNLGPNSASDALIDRLHHIRDCTGIEGRDPPPGPGGHYCE